MPSAKFTESEVLEPSESFCEREKISEVEADLRAYFAWEIGKPLPGWIYDKLDMFPHLRRHACGFLSFLRTTTSSFNEQERSLYDIMIDCMITDLLMIALQRSNAVSPERIQRPSDSSGLGQHCSRHKISLVFSAGSTRRTQPVTSSSPTLNANLYRAIITPVMVLFFLVPWILSSCKSLPQCTHVISRNRMISIFCSHFVFCHLCVITRILFIRLKNTSVTIRCIPPENVNSVSTSNKLLSAVQHHYGYSPELVQKNIREARAPEPCGIEFMVCARLTVKALTNITDLLTEWVQLFSSQYYTFSRKTDIYGRSIIDRLTVALEHHDDCADITVKSTPWKKHSDKKKTIEIPPVDVDNLFFSLFADPKHVENPQGLFLEQFRELVNSSELERRLSYSLNENADLTPYIDALCQTLNAARSSRIIQTYTPCSVHSFPIQNL